MKKFFSRMVGLFRVPENLQDHSLENAMLSFIKNERKMTILFFTIIIATVIGILYIGGAYETPQVANPVFYSETSRPIYSTPTIVLTPEVTSTP